MRGNRHINIPIFIPHMGCPNDCVFCNQKRITGTQKFDILKVREEIEKVLSTSSGAEVQIAFFGGSFTGIERELMVKLLSLGKEYIDAGAVSSLRCSTRPDYINEEILEILYKYGMKSIELGIQSTSDAVLKASKRGHSAAKAKAAMILVKAHGFELVGQMMVGLPASSVADEIKTAKDICNCRADGARIYPTVVFKDTQLADMAGCGEYTPLTKEEAVERSVAVKKVFIEHKVQVLRVGLYANESLCSGDDIAFGEFDESVGESVEGDIYYSIIRDEIRKGGLCGGEITVFVSPGCVSRASGIKKANKIRLRDEFGFKNIKIKEDEKIREYEVKITREKEVR